MITLKSTLIALWRNPNELSGSSKREERGCTRSSHRTGMTTGYFLAFVFYVNTDFLGFLWKTALREVAIIWCLSDRIGTIIINSFVSDLKITSFLEVHSVLATSFQSYIYLCTFGLDMHSRCSLMPSDVSFLFEYCTRRCSLFVLLMITIVTETTWLTYLHVLPFTFKCYLNNIFLKS